MGHVKRAALKLIRCQYSLVWSQINVYILSNESKSYGARSPFLLIKRCSRCNFAINWHFQVAKYRLFSIFLLTFLINAWAKERTAAITNFCSKVFSFKCLNSGNSLGTKANTTGTKSLFQLLFSFFRLQSVFFGKVAIGMRMQNRFSIATKRRLETFAYSIYFIITNVSGITWFAQFWLGRANRIPEECVLSHIWIYT